MELPIVVANKVDDPQGESLAVNFTDSGWVSRSVISVMHGHGTGQPRSIVAALPARPRRGAGRTAVRDRGDPAGPTSGKKFAALLNGCSAEERVIVWVCRTRTRPHPSSTG